jgi:hypothetical protein
MILKPQDIVYLLKLVPEHQQARSYNALAVELEMSPSEVHAASRRVVAAQLAVRQDRRVRPHFQNLQEFLVHGLRYVFVPDRGELTRGMPTAFAAPPLAGRFQSSNEPPPVWPDPEGPVRGESFSPLYRSVPAAARRDKDLYELLVLVDAIRGGRARERQAAVKELDKRLAAYG